jgi:hypothetical protein
MQQKYELQLLQSKGMICVNKKTDLYLCTKEENSGCHHENGTWQYQRRKKLYTATNSLSLAAQKLARSNSFSDRYSYRKH